VAAGNLSHSRNATFNGSAKAGSVVGSSLGVVGTVGDAFVRHRPGSSERREAQQQLGENLNRDLSAPPSPASPPNRVRLVVCVIVCGTDGLGKWSALNDSSPGRIFIITGVRKLRGRLGDFMTCWSSVSPEQVFKDIDNIEPGEDFVKRITAAVASCDVLLALIGEQWVTMKDESGQRRLDNPGNYVPLEIETALRGKIRVIAILVDDVRMPYADELPATLAP
jgi:hypothetical protein